MYKKILSLILCSVMLTAAFSSCGDKDQQTNTSGDSGKKPISDNGQNTTLTEEEQKIVDNRINDLKAIAPDGFDGAEFVFVGRESNSFPTEENLIGNPESDAIYKRNIKVEEQFITKIVNVRTENGPDTANSIINDQNSGTSTYSLGFGNLGSTLNILFNSGVIDNINNYSQINPENPWWLSSMSDYYAIGDDLFFLSGDILPEFFDVSSCILFSKQLISDYGINTDLYSVVTDGEWTVDKMFEVASVIPGGGDVKRYGQSVYNAGMSFFISSGFTVTKFDGDHMPYIDNALPKEVFDLAAKISTQTGDDSLSYIYNLEKKLGGEEITDLFADNKFLFNFAQTGHASILREKDINGFGILPYPKASLDQENYITLAESSGSGSIVIPKNVKDPIMVGVITEALGAYSYQFIRPVFYDSRLKSKSVYDIESKYMLDIIYSTQVYDMCDFYGGASYNTGNGEIYKTIAEGIFCDDSNLASGYANRVRVTKNYIRQMINQAKKIAG